MSENPRMTPHLGVLTPVVTAARAARWEADGTIHDLRRIAQAADRLGYDYLTCSEHVGVPSDIVDARGSRYWDPLSTFGYMAAHTERIRFATNVLVLGYHHPLGIAKRYGTLDVVSGGRLILGLGVGSLEEEFALLDVPFADRGPRADDALRALRQSMSVPIAAYEGPYFSFKDSVIDPCAQQGYVPFWIGGRTARSLRRAVELGDGWMPFGLDVADTKTMLDRASHTAAWSARERPLTVVLQNLAAPVDPADAPEQTSVVARELIEAGATTLMMRFVHHSVEHYLEQLEAMAVIATRLW